MLIIQQFDIIIYGIRNCTAHYFNKSVSVLFCIISFNALDESYMLTDFGFIYQTRTFLTVRQKFELNRTVHIDPMETDTLSSPNDIRRF